MLSWLQQTVKGNPGKRNSKQQHHIGTKGYIDMEKEMSKVC
jgi:hypothetical protein